LFCFVFKNFYNFIEGIYVIVGTSTLLGSLGGILT
jgi:hypothetical protein